MKFEIFEYCGSLQASLPLREAWIEIDGTVTYIMLPRSLPLREAWIEISLLAIASNDS